MQISAKNNQPLRDELDVMQELLPLNGARLLELGCGRAEKATRLAATTEVASILAAEVDQHAYKENLRHPVPKVTFASFGAEQIAAEDNSFDLVMMLKSLHHVPAELMPAAFAEIARVLVPGGLLYLSEPVFAGNLNEVIRLFHDEQGVREHAFDATVRAVTDQQFELVQQYFFLTPVKIKSFAQFRAGIIDATHTRHILSDQLLGEVQAKFESFRADESDTDGAAPYRFETPNRVDLLRVLK